MLAALVFLGSMAPASALAGAPIAGPPPSPCTLIDTFVVEASQRFGVPVAWINAVMAVESRGLLQATSPKGAMGLMQLMPATWADMRSKLGLGSDPYDPHDNILAGAAYLRELYDRFGPGGFLSAYNAGPERYLDHVTTGRPLPAETRAYVAKLAPAVTSGDVPAISTTTGLTSPFMPRHTLFVPVGKTVGQPTEARAQSPDPRLFIAVTAPERAP